MLNQAADTLSCHPRSNDDDFSGNESDEYNTILYAMVCNDLTNIIKDEKLPLDIKRTIQCIPWCKNSYQNQKKNKLHCKMVDILSKASTGMTKEAMEEDIDISKTICYLKSGKKGWVKICV